MRIEEVGQEEFEEWLELALMLWSDGSAGAADEMRITLTEILQSPRQAGFLLRESGGSAIAFMNLSLRSDYVAGASCSPVAFVEGIYVKPAYRRQGAGKLLIEFAERWAVDRGCAELASDALLENTVSHAFHQKAGFEEVERVVCFIKPIAPHQGQHDD